MPRREFRDPSSALDRAAAHRDTFLQLFHARVAQAALHGQGAGPLAGVPFAIKDVFDVNGTRTSAASHARDSAAHATRDAAVVELLVAAGAVPIGKVTLSEFAYSGLGINRRFGTPTIEHDNDHYLAGGSSSGSAAAVAAGIVPFALATDTSGSIRIPAAWTGTIGFRASQDRYDRRGMLPLSPTLDAVGVIADSVDMLLTVDNVLGRTPHTTSRATDLVVPEGLLLETASSSIITAFRRATQRLADAGWNISYERIPSLDHARALLDQEVTIVERDALNGFARGIEHSRQLESSTRARLDWARAQLHGSGNQLRAEMSALRAAFARQLGDRLLLTPSCLIPAPRFHENQDAIAELELNARALRLPMTLSYLGCPGATVPTWQFGRSSGILISAPADHDDYILTALPDIATAFPSERSPRVRPQVPSLTP